MRTVLLLAGLGLAGALPGSAAAAASAPAISAPQAGDQFGSAAIQVIWDEADPASTSGFDVYVVLGSCSASGGSVHVNSDGTSTTYGANVTLGPTDGRYCITVVAHDSSGGPDQSSAVDDVLYDTTPPGLPGSPLAVNAPDEFPRLTFGPGSGDGAGSGVATYTVYRGAVPIASLPVGDGSRRSYVDNDAGPGITHYAVTISDELGNESAPALVDARYDGPSATIRSHPQNPSHSTTAVFTFSGSSAAASFRCALDGPPAACSSPFQRTVSNCRHTFTVTAVDGNGTAGSPDSFTWQVNPSGDTTGPAVSVNAPAVAGRAVPVSATVADPSGISEVVFQYQAPGGPFTTFADVKPVSGPTASASWLTGGPLVDGAYLLRAIATDGSCNSTSSAPVTVAVDNTAPATPATPIAAASPTRGAPVISWAASADPGVTGYSVYRLGVPIAANVAATSFTDSLPGGGAADGAYPYTVTAVDMADNASGPSAPVTVVYDTTAPVAPATLTATSNGTTVGLSWPVTADPSKGGVASGVAGYVLRRAAGATAPASAAAGDPVCAVAASVTTCSDAGRTLGQQLSYAVFAVDAAGNPSAGRTATMTVGATAKLPDKTPPGKILKLEVKVKASRATLSWAKPKDADFDHVQVVVNTRRRPRSATDGKRVYRGKATQAAFIGVAGTTSHVAVFAYDHAGNRSSATFGDARFPRAALQPLAGTALTGSPRLSWKPVREASYYNVQVFRIVGRKRVAISWPRATSYTIPRSKLVKGKSYVWYVWPGFGKLSDAHYGKLIGHSTFAYR